jgi:addiction module HigA family antidote
MPRQTKTPASILQSFMNEYQLNPHQLSKAIHVPYSTARYLITKEIKITAPMALRLAKLFGTTPDFWLNLQQEIDLIEAGNDKKLQANLKEIRRAVKPAVGPRPKARAAKGKAISAKRKQAAKVPGSKPASRKKL